MRPLRRDLPRALAPRRLQPPGGLLEVQHSPAAGGRAVLLDRRGHAAVAGSGVWRFRELLLPGAGETITHPEGNTPLYRRDAVARYVGHDMNPR